MNFQDDVVLLPLLQQMLRLSNGYNTHIFVGTQYPHSKIATQPIGLSLAHLYGTP